MAESWRDEPVTKGELHDALIAAADDVKRRSDAVEDRYPGGIQKQLLRYAAAIQGDLFRQTANNLKNEE